MQKSYVVYKIDKTEMVWLKVKVGGMESFLPPLGDPLKVQWA